MKAVLFHKFKIICIKTIHCDKSLGKLRAIARNSAGNKCYSTLFSEVKNPWLFN